MYTKCPSCEEYFFATRDQVTCGNPICRSSFFSSGENHWNWKGGLDYRKVCFENHGSSCLICKSETNVDVHHIDENRDNNSPDNLIPLCRSHHKKIHGTSPIELQLEILTYIKKFKNDLTNELL